MARIPMAWRQGQVFNLNPCESLMASRTAVSGLQFESLRGPELLHNPDGSIRRPTATLCWISRVPSMGGRSRWFIDGRELALHGGRNHPVVPMTISFGLGFAPGGPLPPSAAPRVWVQDIDWVLHAADLVLTPADVPDEVKRLRTRGITRIDTVPRPVPAQEDRCEF